MSQTGYAAQRRRPGVMVAILGGHAAVLAAVMLIKMDLPIPFVDEPTVVITLPADKPPPPDVPPPPDPSPRPQPRVDQRVDMPPPVVPAPVPGPDLAPPTAAPPNFSDAPPGPTIDLPPAPPTPVSPPPAPIPDPPVQRAKPVALAPRGNPASWVTNDDYPAAALRGEEQGRTRFMLTVAADGRPSACTITGSSGSPTLDQAACRLLMKRAKFAPGKDADGQPTGGTWTKSFLWQIPED